MSDYFYRQGRTAALDKYASRGREMARQWGEEFNVTRDPRALALAARAGEASFSPTSRPVQLASIPHGGETQQVGLHIAPENGRATAQVWKTYNPGANPFSPELMQRRADIAAKGNPIFARLYGQDVTEAGLPRTRNEFVPGVPHDKLPPTPENQRKLFETRRAAMRAGHEAGFDSIRDLRPENIINGRVIDYMPFKRDEVASRPLTRLMGKELATTSRGTRLFPNVQGDPVTEDMMADVWRAKLRQRVAANQRLRQARAAPIPSVAQGVKTTVDRVR